MKTSNIEYIYIQYTAVRTIKISPINCYHGFLKYCLRNYYAFQRIFKKDLLYVDSLLREFTKKSIYKLYFYSKGIGKRSAEEEAAPEHAYGLHPSGGKSYVGNTVWGARGKRSAEPEPHYGYYGYPGYGYHGYGARSFVGRTVWGLGK